MGSNHLTNDSGQSLVEVIVAATVGIIVVVALTFATIFSLRNANFAQTSAQATKLAQEGIERVKTGRDRNSSITGNFSISGQSIGSWSDNNLWTNEISPNCIPNCYFNINPSGELQYLTAAPSIPSNAELIDKFQRVVVLSDNSSLLPDGITPSYKIQKTVTVIVTWTDTTGPHESRLATILRKL